MGYAQTYHQIYWLRALMGVSEALYLPTALAMIADFHNSKTRSLAIGIHMSGLYTGQALGGFGATIAANYSWQTVFHWFGIAGIIYTILLVFFLYDKEGHAGTKSARQKKSPQIAPLQKESMFKSIRSHPWYTFFLDHALLLHGTQLPRLGNQKLASHTVFRKPGD